MMPASLPAWGTVETELALRPKPAVVRLAAKVAARLVPTIVEGSSEYGPEAIEWAHAADSVVKIVEAYLRGEAVSRFTLDLAAEVARGTANAAANVVRMLGHSQAAADSELAFAAAAFAADAARLSSPVRSATAAMQALRTAQSSGRIAEELLARDYANDDAGEPLWSDGEPAWFTEGRAALAAAKGLPEILRSVPAVVGANTPSPKS
jgi:hypothetical protein